MDETLLFVVYKAADFVNKIAFVLHAGELQETSQRQSRRVQLHEYHRRCGLRGIAPEPLPGRGIIPASLPGWPAPQRALCSSFSARFDTPTGQVDWGMRDLCTVAVRVPTSKKAVEPCHF